MEWLLIIAAGILVMMAKGNSDSVTSGLTESNAVNLSDDDDYHHSLDDDFSSSIISSSLSIDAGSMFDDSFTNSPSSINPANGLPMVGCLDICGNPYGTDFHSDDHSFSSNSMFDDHFSSSSSSMFDDHFSSSSSSMFDDSFSSSSFSSFND